MEDKLVKGAVFVLVLVCMALCMGVLTTTYGPKVPPQGAEASP